MFEHVDEKEAAELVAAMKETLTKVNAFVDRLSALLDRVTNSAPAKPNP